MLTGATGSIALLHDRITDADRERADRLMAEIGVEPLRDVASRTALRGSASASSWPGP